MIDRHTLIKDILQKIPGSQKILMDHGVRCLG